MFSEINKCLGRRRQILVLGLTLLFLLSFFLPIYPALAASSLEIYTQYPGIMAAAGDNIQFPLVIKNNSSSGMIVNLKCTSLPKGWTTSIRGQGREITQVFVDADNSSYADLKVNVPSTAKPGSYHVAIRADSAGFSDTIKLTINLSEAGGGSGDELTAQYAELQGPRDATFNFSVSLTNNSSIERNYSLGAQAPEGWSVTFTPSYQSQQVASLNVKSGASQNLDVKVVPAATAEEGEYKILIGASSTGGKVEKELKVIISGTYKLEFTTPTGRLNASVTAGGDSLVNMVVNNKGGATLQDINFTSSQPPNWAVKFEPGKIDSLKPGETRQVTATITADNKAIAGDYVVSLSASTRETRSSADLRVTVKTSTLWGVAGVILVLLVIAGVYKVFQTYGRR